VTIPERTIKRTEQPIRKERVVDAIHNKQSSPFKKYQDFFVGKSGLAAFLLYEGVNCISGPLPGALGFALRKWFYPCLLKHSGKGVIWGRNVALRNPGNLSIDDLTAIDDGCLFDAKGAGSQGISIGREVIISRNCVIQGKTGYVKIGAKTDIGCNTVVTSASGIEIGESVLIAANCYIGGGRYFADKIGVPFMDQGVYSRGPILIGNGSWLGASVTVLDGIRIGSGCIIGAGAVVTKDLPENVVAGGVPARVLYHLQNRDKL